LSPIGRLLRSSTSGCLFIAAFSSWVRDLAMARSSLASVVRLYG
jgi:hypothetical protein